MSSRGMVKIGGLQVYLPTGATDTTPKRLAQRPESLRGMRVGILDNHKEFADLVLRGVVDALKRDYGVAEVVFWKKNYLGIPSPFAREMAATCDAVINGVGH